MTAVALLSKKQVPRGARNDNPNTALGMLGETIAFTA
jgi:hypothetical protein